MSYELAKGSTSSGRSSSPSRSSASSKSSSSSSAGKSSTKPGGKITTKDGKEVQSSTKTPSNSKYKSSAGIVGDGGYQPRFNNGYSAPAGSVVYYPEHSFIDYLPWIFLFSQSSPQHDQVTVVEPDGKEVQAQPEPGGMDGMVIFNWIMLILIICGVIGGIVWGVFKWQNRK